MRLPTARERLVELAVQWVRGLPVGERASAAFRSEEVRLRVATIVARSPEILPMTAEHIGKFVADAPDVGDLRYPNDLQGVARLLVDVGAGFRRGTAGGMSAPAMRRYLHRYFVPAVFIDPD